MAQRTRIAEMFLKIIISVVCLSCCVLMTSAKEDSEEEQILKYVRPSDEGLAYFAEPFHSTEEFQTRWKHSQAKKDGVDDSIAKYDGKWSVTEPKDNPMIGDNGLIFMSEAKHGAISAPLPNSFKFEDKPLVVQYEVRFQKRHECGGAYIKLLAETPSLRFDEFGDKTEYTIMFGPDKCGGDGKLHFIFQHKNPVTHKMEEKHAKKPTGEFNNIFDDAKTHLVGLIVRPDNTFEIQVDKVVVNAGNLLKDMEPPINPPKFVDDPDDVKPEEWDEREKIADPNASKPDDWDEDAPKTITDPDATKPDGWLDDEPELAADPAAAKPQDWDEAEDGEWEAPQIPNPKCKAVGCGEWKPPTITNPAYKGKWTAPLIDNPDYKGIWKAKQIENPNYFEDNNPFKMKPIAAVGFELWSMQSEILFDNIIIADDMSLVNQWTLQTWDLKHSKEVKDDPNAGGISGLWKSFMETTHEKPWIWAIVVVAVLLPIIMIYLLCCTGGKDDSAAIYKKTDEVLPDDEPTDTPSIDEVNEEVPADVSSEGDGKTSADDADTAQNIEEVSGNIHDQLAEKKVEEEEKEVVENVDIHDVSKKVVADTDPIEDVSSAAEVVCNGDTKESTKELSNIEDSSVILKDDSSKEDITTEPDKVETNGVDTIEDTAPEEIPHPSPKTRASRRKTRKDS